MANINLDRRAIINYKMVRGDTFAPPPVAFTINNVPESFLGCTLKLAIRSGENLLKEIAIGTGITVDANSILYSIDATDTKTFPPGNYPYDVQKTDGSGIVSTIQAGTINIASDQVQ
jgi:hypothetical protein